MSCFECTDKTMRKLSLKDELFMVLVKFKLNLLANYTGQRKGIDAATVCRMLHK